MLAVNGDFASGELYRRSVTGFKVGTVEFTFWARNIIGPLPTTRPVKPKVTYFIEDTDGTKLFTATTGDILEGGWVEFSGTFNVPLGSTELAFVLELESEGNSGNDLAIDDISFTQFISCDLDSDGIMNSLDTDSDNDGCPDALEGDGGFSAADINPDGTINSTVDGNGVPASTGTGTSPQVDADGSATINTVTAGQCDDDADGVVNSNDVCNGFDDNLNADGDAVPNGCDLDDDNDGILDSVECPPTPATFIYNEVLSTTSALVYTATIDGQQETITVSPTASGSPFLLGPSGVVETNTTYLTAGATPYIQIDDLGSGEAALDMVSTIGLKSIRFVVFDDFDRGSSSTTNQPSDAITMSLAGSWSNLVGDMASYSLTTGNLIENNSAGNAVVSLSANNDNQFELNDKLGQSDILMRGSALDETNNVEALFNANADFTNITLLFEDIALNGARETARAYLSPTSFMVILGCPDSDGDGIVDGFDIDSDNDGIYDAVEAGHDQVHSNGLMTGNVGTDGIADSIQDTGQEDSGIINFSYADSDGDNSIDSVESDSDNDGCNDVIEAGYTDSNSDGILGPNPVTVDGNGMVTSGADGYTTPIDTAGVFDYRIAPAAITINSQPADQTVFAGNNATFAINSTNTNFYQWQVSTDGGLSFADIIDGSEYSGATTSTLTVISVEIAKNGYLYRLLVSNTANNCIVITSGQALLTTRVRTVITNRNITKRVNKN